jgi:hypothetical protein
MATSKIPDPEAIQFPHNPRISTQFSDAINTGVKDSIVQIRFGAMIIQAGGMPPIAQECARVAVDTQLAKRMLDNMAKLLDHYPKKANAAPAQKKRPASTSGRK